MYAASGSCVHSELLVVEVENTRTQNKMKERDDSERLFG